MQIHDRYIEISLEAISRFENPCILKTDCFNEATFNRPLAKEIPSLAVVCIDTNREMVRLAGENFKNVIAFEDDIRSMEFDNEYFDVVIDLSTIDHVEEYDEALYNYHRVLKKGGICVVFSWLSVNKEEPIKEDRDMCLQYVHYFKDFRREVKKKFKILKEAEATMDIPFSEIKDSRFMYYFLCKKK